MTKYEFRSLAMLCEMYFAGSADDAGIKSGTTFYLASDADTEIRRLREALDKSRRTHYICEDPWYSCPKSEKGCINEGQGDECNCGADKWNAYVDSVLGHQPKDDTR